MSDAADLILIVDDDEDIRETLELVLSLEGYTVETARDGIEALARLAVGRRPALILLDLMMPRMSGEEVLLALENDPDLATIPVVVLSGDPQAPRKGAALGADEVLLKPVDLQSLRRSVDQHRRSAAPGPELRPSSS